MKKISVALIMAIALIVTACVNKTEQQLAGAWQGVANEANGIRFSYRIDLNDSHKFTAVFDASMPFVPEAVSAELNGAWKADKDSLYVDVDTNDIKITVNDGVYLLFAQAGYDKADVDSRIRRTFVEEMDMPNVAIKSLTDSTLTVANGDLTFDFRRVN